MQHISCNLPLLAAHAIKSMALRRKDPNLQAAGNLQSSRTRQLLKASVSHDAHRHKAGASVRQGSESPPSPRARPPRGTDPDFHDNNTLPCSPSSTCPSSLSPVVMLITAMESYSGPLVDLTCTQYIYAVSTPANGTIRSKQNFSRCNGSTVENRPTSIVKMDIPPRARAIDL